MHPLYSADLLDVYDLQHDTMVDDLPFYTQMLSWHQPHRVAELGCGTGRLLPTLLGDGRSSVTGIDSSPDALQRARLRVALYPAAPQRIHFVQADMRGFALAHPQDCVIAGLNTFMHLITPHDQRRCLVASRQSLVQGGLLILDLHNPFAFLSDRADGRLRHRFTSALPDGSGMVSQWAEETLDLAEQTVQVLLITDRTDAAQVVTRRYSQFTLRFSFRYEVEALLGALGFEVEDVYGDYHLEAYQEDSRRLLVVARAQGLTS